MTRPAADWINTFTGRKFWPCDPRVADIDILDIAHALSMQCRFTGHVRRFYSVAEHSVRVSRYVPSPDQLWGLLHDAAEAYLTDLARPIKHQPDMRAYRDAEAQLMTVICQRYDLPIAQPASVTDADHRMLITEANELMVRHDDWLIDWPGEPYHHMEAAGMGWRPAFAERRYLDRFEELYASTHTPTIRI